jgi:FKBP-type peptidyl-prolyl cis-trans isomerase 2
MRQAKAGDTVQVHYKGSLDDGTVFDSSEGSDPIEFTIGEGHVVPGFETAIVGMAVGDNKTATIACEDAYGERREDLLFPVGRDEVPPGLEVEVGDILSVGLANGESVPMQVTAVGEDTLTLDANHPLAGKALVFELSLVSIA